jgi:hypothetical protein
MALTARRTAFQAEKPGRIWVGEQAAKAAGALALIEVGRKHRVGAFSSNGGPLAAEIIFLATIRNGANAH